MRYKTLDGKVFEAASPEDLAQQLWQSKFIPEPSLPEWMDGSAQRALLYDGSRIRTDSTTNHIEDLIASGFLEPL